jgi:PKD repeat protein
MVSLVKSLFIPIFNGRAGVPIRITPSTWSNAVLSARSIPFYYNIGGVYKSWNALKTRKGKPTYNLSYNADKYTPPPPDSIVNPLLYGIEPYDFYRIEGHIGQPYTSVLNVILSIRNSNRLPFDVIALKAGTDAADTAIKYDCHFEDIETQFALLRAELACKMHEPLCIAAKVPSILRFNTGNDNIKFNFLSTINVVHAAALQDIVINKNLINTSFVQATRFSRKGDFLKTYCPVIKGTLGAVYNDSVNKFFPRPAQIDLTTVSGSRAALLHLIDITEGLMQTITGASTIYNFKYDNFKRIYDSMISFFTEFMQALLTEDKEQKALNPLMYGNLEAVVTGCIDEKIKALTTGYTKRVEKIQKQNLLSEYLISNPGIDHKAGVPRGGTFIIVYHDAPANTIRPGIATTALTNITNAEAIAVDTDKPITKLADTSVINKNNLTKILKLFDTAELQLSATQATALKNLTLQQFAVAAAKLPFNIPDNAVVADFYLPYLCCSDCPPVTYVLPKVQQDILLLTLEKTDFCNNDEKTYKVTVNPLGGTLTASAGGIDADKLEFKPKGLVAGINKITYTLPDGRSINVDIKITAAFEINFDFSSSPDNPLVRKFIPVNTENKTVSWNFGDGTALSTEQSPTHNFVITSDTQTFKVTLTATDGPCVITRQQEVVITKPIQQIFSIKPTVFCSNDENLYAFIADPAIPHFTDIENPNELRMDIDGNGNIVFVPAGQGVQQTKSYHLFYKGVSVEISIVAAFQVDFKAEVIATDPLSRRFVASNIENKIISWNFGDGTPPSSEPSPLHTYQFTESEKVFLVTLSVTDGPCSATVEQNILVSRPVPVSFSIEPVAFCNRDRQRKIFAIQPLPNDLAEIKNENNLNLERDAANGDVFFIPAKQNISQTKSYALSYRGIDMNLTMFVPNAGFVMDIKQNTSPVAVFPLLLTLTAKEVDADSYSWILSNNFGQKFEFKDRVIKDFNMAQLNDPNRSPVPLNIILVVGQSKRTGVTCEDKKDYIITSDVLGNHRNKGEFDNLSPS